MVVLLGHLVVTAAAAALQSRYLPPAGRRRLEVTTKPAINHDVGQPALLPGEFRIDPCHGLTSTALRKVMLHLPSSWAYDRVLAT